MSSHSYADHFCLALLRLLAEIQDTHSSAENELDESTGHLLDDAVFVRVMELEGEVCVFTPTHPVWSNLSSNSQCQRPEIQRRGGRESSVYRARRPVGCGTERFAECGTIAVGNLRRSDVA